MDFAGPDHIYWVAPPTNGNLAQLEENQVKIGLTCATVPDLDAEQLAQSVIAATEPQSKWQSLIKDRTFALIASKFKGVKNLTIASKEVKDFDDFYHNGPPEMVAWVCKAVMSSETLTAAERKN